MKSLEHFVSLKIINPNNLKGGFAEPCSRVIKSDTCTPDCNDFSTMTYDDSGKLVANCISWNCN